MAHAPGVELEREVAGHAMRRRFPSVPPNTPLDLVGQVMERTHLDLVPVVLPGRRIAGVVLKSDLPQPGKTAAEVMHLDLASATYEEPIPSVLDKMAAAHVTALPVELPGHCIEGLVVLADLTAESRAAARAARAHMAVTRARLVMDRVAAPASVALGLCLLAVATWAGALNGPAWLSWLGVAGAALATVAAGLFRTPEVVAIALWALLGASFLAIFIFCRLIGAPGWVTWSHLAIACCFVLLVVAGAAANQPAA
jgi:CBS domain-containing protein